MHEIKDSPEVISFYDQHTYDEFWIGRDYEHLSEIMAIKSLIGERKFINVLDYGGGYGRLAPTLSMFAENVIIADPSIRQLNLAKSKLNGQEKVQTVHLKENGKIPLANGSVDMVVMVRVSHHLLDPKKNFVEINRVLSEGGLAIIEIANSSHILNRLRYMFKLRRVPKESIKIGRAANGILEETPFLNHNVSSIESVLSECGFSVLNKLSVSNLRSQFLKKYIRIDHLLYLERILQTKMARYNFGPSMFLLVQKS